MKSVKAIMDGNEAAAHIAYKTNEICAIYPITPSSAMGEAVDLWSSQNKANLWGLVPKVIEMQSEGGAAGALHGALISGTLATTFTASQGLLLMIPNMYKIAGELLPCVIHVAARSIATHALSIFGDHSDVMACRQTGFAMLFSSSVQEAMDMALIAQATTLKARIPFLHVFDGFRTSHEINKINLLDDAVIRKMIDEEEVQAFKQRGLNPAHPSIRGTAQNPDVFFQSREAANKYYNALPGILRQVMNDFALLTDRQYHLYEYYGHPEAEEIIIVMGSACGTVEETVNHLNKSGRKTGYLKVRLFRPFYAEYLLRQIPPSVKSIAVLDRTKEPGSAGEPLYQDVVTAFNSSSLRPEIFGGRYGLSSKEFTPAMVVAIFDAMKSGRLKNSFTVGIKDDVTHLSLNYSKNLHMQSSDSVFNAMFYGLGSDGTVSANKNTIKIIGDATDNYVQGYFVYDSKKAGAMTISHLRFGAEPIHSAYLIDQADFIACHRFSYLFKYDILDKLKQGGTFLLNAPYSSEQNIASLLPAKVVQTLVNKQARIYVVDATAVARQAGLGNRINTVLQTCFFAISGILPQEKAIELIKKSIVKSYGHKGEEITGKNLEAVEQAVSGMYEVKLESNLSETEPQTSNLKPQIPQTPDFVTGVLNKIIAGHGEELPVSAMPADGVFPSATSQWEKRNIALQVPQWDEQLCTQCNKCLLICPHAAIRAKVVDKQLLSEAPATFKSVRPIGKDFDTEKTAYTLQVAVEDCTGCYLCVEYCPVKSKTDPSHKAINMVEADSVKEEGILNWNYFLQLPETDASRLNRVSVKGSQMLRPLFEFSGACAGCGETPYLKLLTQLYGEQMLVANATGCSSIYGGNLPTTPWAMNADGRGPAWANSLFEDNAEFGLGLRLAANKKKEQADYFLNRLKGKLGDRLVEGILDATKPGDDNQVSKTSLISELLTQLKTMDSDEALQLAFIADYLIPKSVWIIGGDGWAYDIGYGGLDHIFSVGEDVNVLVMDTEVYSNTGGQTSKATPLGASAKFSISGKRKAKKKLSLHAIAYGNVYVAQVAMGANDTQTIRAIHEASEYPGTSLIIAYSHCIEHGYDMRYGTSQQDKAVKSGYWPLFRFNPLKPAGSRFILDSKEPSIPLKDYIYNESRYTRLLNKNGVAEELLALAEQDVKQEWERIKSLQML